MIYHKLDRDFINIYAQINFHQNHEIVENYPRKSNFELFNHYGFITYTNPIKDCFYLDLNKFFVFNISKEFLIKILKSSVIY